MTEEFPPVPRFIVMESKTRAPEESAAKKARPGWRKPFRGYAQRIALVEVDVDALVTDNRRQPARIDIRCRGLTRIVTLKEGAAKAREKMEARDTLASEAFKLNRDWYAAHPGEAQRHRELVEAADVEQALGR